MTRHTEADLWQIAETVLTDRQLHVCRLIWVRRLSIRQTALILDVSPSTVTSHLRTSRRRIAAAITLRKDTA
jgi:DNA-binding CsgD family transcriptional regulator